MPGLSRGHSGKESPCSAGEARDAGSIPGPGRSPGEGNGNPLQYSVYIYIYIYVFGASLVAQLVKNSPAMQRPGRLGFNAWVGKIPWRRE